jgi:hypothetical protein
MLPAVRPSALLLTALLLSGGLLAGCGDDEEPGSQPSGRPTSSEPSSTAGAATGPLVDQATFSFHLPQLWSEGKPHAIGSDVTSVSGGPADGWDFTDLTVETWTAKNFDDVTQLSGDVLENFRVSAPKGRLVGVTQWAGQPAYHLAGNGSLAGHAEQFGVIWKDAHIALRFDFASPATATGTRRPEFELTPVQRQELMDSVEASWQWK